MNTFRIALIGIIVAIATACSSTSTKPIATITPAAPSIANVAGNWALAVNAPTGVLNFKMAAVQTSHVINAKITDDKGTYDYDGAVNGSNVKFGHDSKNMPGMRIEYIGTADGDAMSGKVVFGSFGEGTFTAKRQ